MMTARGRWMTLPAMIGLFLGVLQRTPELSLLSLSVLLWLAAEWTLFCWRVRVELPRLQIERMVNGLSEPTGRLWAGRTATIVVKVTRRASLEVAQFESREATAADGRGRHPTETRFANALSREAATELRHSESVATTRLEAIKYDRSPWANAQGYLLALLGSSKRSTTKRFGASSLANASDDMRAASTLSPVVLIHDVVPENIEVLSRSHADQRLTGNQFELRFRTRAVTLEYLVRVRGAGEVTLPGVRLRLQDAQGFFLAERFISLSQTFRVLPAFAEAGDVQPLVKRTNSLPQHGIHRLQRSGLGSELLELREYVAGDPPKAIAWKVSARRDKLMTRQYESEVPVRVQLFVDGSMGTRLGGFGCRLLDQMTFVAASVARVAISVGDPVGAMLFDERETRRLPPLTGERGFYRLLDALADFSINPAGPPPPLSPRMISAAMSLAGERYPELLDNRVNQVPFTLLPILPHSRRRFREHFLLAGVLAEVFQLSAAQQVRLVHQSSYLAEYIQRFLDQSGVAWMEHVLSEPNALASGESEPAASAGGSHQARMNLLSDSLVKTVSHARDNEVFVVLANLLEHASHIKHLLPAVKMALGRHHRVAFVCPSPTFRRPTTASTIHKSNSIDALMAAAEQIQIREEVAKLHRKLHRLGATVTCSGEKEAIHLVLSEMEIARSGRVVAGESRR